jgi:tripeptidyl-peptidase-1
MFGASIFLTVAVAAQAVFGSPIQSRTAYAVKETHRVPRKWVKTGRAPADKMLNLQIGVKQGHFGELERHLYEGMCAPLLHWGKTRIWLRLKLTQPTTSL